jgi:peptide/nickel transport system permease protein
MMESAEIIFQDSLAKAGIFILGAYGFLAIFGPTLAPYGALEQVIQPGSQYEILRYAPPSLNHPLGTTAQGRDVLSIIFHGSRITLYVGLVAGGLTGALGFLVGLVSGYYGGWVDYILMRITDIMFGLPYLGMALAILSAIEPRNEVIILTLALLLWRLPVRVIRSEVLSVKEKEFVKSSKAIGAKDLHVMFRVIMPNVLPLTFIYISYGIAWAIIGEASLAFLGFGDPTTMSWGRSLQLAYESGSIGRGWWTWLPQAISISLVVSSVYFILRGYEEVINPSLRS